MSALATSPHPAKQMSPEEAAKWSQAESLDYAAIGFRCGLEIHQQLDTRKLFSPCPSEVVEPTELARRATAMVDRRLRATGSELGEVDVAALAEARRNRTFRYMAISGLTSLVETDDEPPHPLAPEALDVTLTFAALTQARPAAEVHVMRKTVIDGSNTSGFQRTALVATGGRITIPGEPQGTVGIWTIAVEEDSARKVGEVAGTVAYSLDRLGIPLIEVATAPDIRDPAHAQRTAARIGALLRATGRVKRGLGTIRQDLNVSVGVGERVEVKGCQDLRSVPRVIELECRRQLWMHAVRGQLTARGAQEASIGHPSDVTQAFAATGAKSVKESVAKGGKVLGLRLPRFAGLLKGATKDGPRLGRELADHAKAAAGVKGIFHSDELPAYGIGDAEVAAVRSALSCAADDAFVLCVETEPVARRALEAAAERARQAVRGPVKEVRAAQPDDSSRFMRPMPGAARMYPETDVPPTRIAAARWDAIRGKLPELPEARVARIAKQHAVSGELALQLVQEGCDRDFEVLVSAGAEPNLAARIHLQLLPALKHPDRVAAYVPAIVHGLAAGRFAKEAVPDILGALDADASLSPDAAMAKAAAGSADTAAVDEVCRAIVTERLDFVKSKGMAALGPLMGPVMAKLRGKADGQVISARLTAAIQEASK